MANASATETFKETPKPEIASVRPEVEVSNSTEHKMAMSMTMEGDYRILLAGNENETIRAVPVKDAHLVASSGTKLTEVERSIAPKLAEDIESGAQLTEAKEEIVDQFRKTQADAQDVVNLSEFFLDLGVDNIYLVKPDSFDKARVSKRVDFSKFALTFVVPETMKEELVEQIKNKGIDKGAGPKVQVNEDQRHQYLPPDLGFHIIMNIGGQEQKVLFLYGKVWGANKEEQQKIVKGEATDSDALETDIELSDADLKIYDKIAEIYNQHTDNVENCKNEILGYLIEEHKGRISTELRNILDADEMLSKYIPTDIEYAQAKKQK